MPCTAQYFHKADHVVVLGNHGVMEQGSWANIMMKAAAIAKFSPSRQVQDHAVRSTDLGKLDTELKLENETKPDLMRQAGNLTLYGESSFS